LDRFICGFEEGFYGKVMAEGGENINGEQEMSDSAGGNILGDIDKFVDIKLGNYASILDNFRPILLGETANIRQKITVR
jgi:hypothetical protein